MACVGALGLAAPVQAATLFTYETTGILTYTDVNLPWPQYSYSVPSIVRLTLVEGESDPVCGDGVCGIGATYVFYQSTDLYGSTTYLINFDGTGGNPPTDPAAFVSATFDHDPVWETVDRIMIRGTLSNLVITSEVVDGDGYDRTGLWVTATGPVIPEPSTWAMKIGGFALVGAAMRQRRMSVSFA